MSQQINSPRIPSADFRTTHWSVVLDAQAHLTSRSAGSMETLCRTYWYPLYAYVRRRGYGPEDAQDLTQGFFARLIEKDFLSTIRRERGKFRWFLLSAMKRFLANEWNHQHTAKRGGGRMMVSLDEAAEEGRYSREIADHASPDRLFDQSWAMTLLELAERQLQEEYAVTGRGALFEQLKIFLSGDRGPISYAEAGALLQISEGAVKVAVHRLRHRFGACLRELIAQTVSTQAEVGDELRQLRSAFGG